MPGWKLSGQYEEGKEGTRHFQGMLKTPQTRFAAVKRVFPRAHIEAARNALALEKYTTKAETRVGVYEATGVPNMFQAQDIIAGMWNQEHFVRRTQDDAYARMFKYDYGDMALAYVDEMVSELVGNGQRGLEFIAINPMWRSSWKKFYASIIKRNARSSHSPPAPQASPQGTGEEDAFSGTVSSGEEPDR